MCQLFFPYVFDLLYRDPVWDSLMIRRYTPLIVLQPISDSRPLVLGLARCRPTPFMLGLIGPSHIQVQTGGTKCNERKGYWYSTWKSYNHERHVSILLFFVSQTELSRTIALFSMTWVGSLALVDTLTCAIFCETAHLNWSSNFKQPMVRYLS